MMPVERVFSRARQWFSCGSESPSRRLGTWLCATALGEPGPVPELAWPELGSVDGTLIDQPLDLLRADPALLLRLADHIIGQAVYGDLGNRLPDPLLAQWTNALPVAVTVAVRARDLAVTSALLLAGACLRCGESAQLRDAAAFVAAQQQPDGGFGELPADADPALHDTVRVPLSLGCAWALAAQPAPLPAMPVGRVVSSHPG